MGGLIRIARAACGAGILALVLCLSGCASTPNGSEHIVKPGENLYRIGLKYNLNVGQLMKMNGMSKGDSIRSGQRIRVSGPPQDVE